VHAKGDDFAKAPRTTTEPLERLLKSVTSLISRLRSSGERPHAVIKRVFGAGRVLVSAVRRAYVKMMVTAFAFNSSAMYIEKLKSRSKLAAAV
jgi:hypothetical protein